MIDLHTHSTISDGVLSPVELVQRAAKHNIKVLALTDHDCVDGLSDAKSECEKCSIIFVPGVELNISWQTGEFHLLGLGLKKISPDLENVLKKLQKGRDERNLFIIEKMKEIGIDASLEEMQKKFNTKCLGRPHFASYMVEKKLVKTRQLAFDKFIGKNCPWFIDKEGVNLDEAIVAISESGGLPIMAHPLSIYVGFGKIKSVLENLRERGIVGIEAFHPGARYGEALRLEQIARELNLLVTAGSDYHGEAVRADRKLGHASGGRKIEDKIWDDLKNHF